MDNKEEAKTAIERIELKQKKACKKGKATIIAISLVNLISVAVGLILSFDSLLGVICLVAEIFMCVSLYFGVSAIRYIYAAVYALCALRYVHPFLVIVFDYRPNTYTLIIAGIYAFKLIYLITSSVLLFGSKNITEYLYSKKNG